MKKTTNMPILEKRLKERRAWLKEQSKILETTIRDGDSIEFNFKENQVYIINKNGSKTEIMTYLQFERSLARYAKV